MAQRRARNREIAAEIVVEVLDRVVRWDLVEVASFESDTLPEEAVAARLHRIVGTRRAASLAYGWIDGEVDLVLEAAGRRVAFEVGLGKRLPRRQARAAEELGVDVTYVVTLRPGVSEERGAVYVPAWLVLF